MGIVKYSRRWYDHNGNIARAIELFQQLPSSLRVLAAAGILEFADVHKCLGSPDGLKSFGQQRVLGLIQSKQKRRWYDQDEVLHKAINTLLMMGDEYRSETAFRLIVTLESVETYKENCLNIDRPYTDDEIMQIVHEVFTKNLDDLIELTSPDKDTMLPKEAAVQPKGQRKVVDESEGMRLFTMDLPKD